MDQETEVMVAQPGSKSTYVNVGGYCERAGQIFLLGTKITLTAEEFKDLDACRTHFISKAEFDSIFGAADEPYLSERFMGTYPVEFIEKVERARDIVRARRAV